MGYALIHLLDPSAFAFVSDLKVNCQIFLENILEFLLNVKVIVCQVFVLLFDCLLPLSKFA